MKKMMTILFALVIVVSVQAQQKEKGKILSKIQSGFDPASIVGLNQFDEDVVFKTLKIRKKSKKAELSTLLDAYNDQMEDLKAANMGSLVGFGLEMKDVFSEKNWMGILAARSDYKDNIRGVRKQIKASENELEVQLMETLKRRQEKKWFKYTRSLKEEQESQFSVGDMFAFLGM